MSEPIIAIDHLHKVYEPFSRRMRLILRTSTKEPVVALDDVSLEVQPGELRAVLGPNGAGKSTLFRIITGLTTPTAGTATVMGLDTTSRSSAVRRLIGFMPAENRTLLLRHSCRENMAFHGRLQGISERRLKDRVDDTLDLVGLDEAKDRVGFALSSGMLARLMLARAILHRPSVLILDEPTGAVDPIGSYELLHTIQRIAEESNIAVLISSHRLDEVELLNDQVLLLNRGRVVYSGSLASMTTTARRPKIEIVFEHENSVRACADALAQVPEVDHVDTNDTLVTITTELPVGTIMKRLDGHVEDIESIGRRPPRLGDVLAEMLRGKRRDEA
ncbi:MAG: ABC transporter ATP-binding protein [Acidimicrobiia bacterium]